MSINADGSRTEADAIVHIAEKAEEIRTIARASAYDPDTLMEGLVTLAMAPALARDLTEVARHILRSADRDDPAIRDLVEKLADVLA